MKAFHPPLPAGHQTILPPVSAAMQTEPDHRPLTRKSIYGRTSQVLCTLNLAPPRYPLPKAAGSPLGLFVSEGRGNHQDLEDGGRIDLHRIQMRLSATPKPFPSTRLASTFSPLFQIWISPSNGRPLECIPQLERSFTFSPNPAHELRPRHWLQNLIVAI